MNSTLRVIAILLVGVICGALGMAFMSASASTVFAEEIRIQYSFDQQQLSIDASKSSDWESVIRHIENATDAELGRVNALNNDPRLRWSLSYPIRAVVLSRILKAAPEKKAKASVWIEGAGTAVEALANEHLGHTKKAEELFARAKELTRLDSDDGVRQLARQYLQLSDK